MNQRQAAIQLNRILRDNSFDRYALSRRGSIVFERLPFYKTSKKIFKEQSAIGGKHYAFCLLLDVSRSMGSLESSTSDVSIAFDTIKNIVGLLGQFVDINVIIFGNFFYRFSHREFESIKTRQDLRRFIDDMYTIVTKDDNKNHINIKVKKNKSLANHDYQPHPKGFDIGDATYEFLAIQDAISILKNFNGKTGIISLSDGDSYDLYYDGKFSSSINIAIGSNEIDKNTKVSINNVDIRKHTNDTFKSDIVKAEQSIDYIMGVGLRTSYPSNNYGNFIRIDQADEIYKYTIKMMKYLIG